MRELQKERDMGAEQEKRARKEGEKNQKEKS